MLRWVGWKWKKVCNVQLASCCVINESNRKLHTPNHFYRIRSIHNEMEKVFQINPAEHWLNFNFHGALGKPTEGGCRGGWNADGHIYNVEREITKKC